MFHGNGRDTSSTIFQGRNTVADCQQACRLVAGMTAGYFLDDREYDSDALIVSLKKDGIQPGIPPRKIRKSLRADDKHKYLQSWPQSGEQGQTQVS
ncbi:hypothetical protein [uncultured Desulfovibrio sp.]|uniref:hypothetical protein n=1 Tax=uncultured Desulfovibrio sp. TaxID=167968 RepID=UPI0026097DE1|nr:hypothetical protein [uncultured Desulfovibrio sp.]